MNAHNNQKILARLTEIEELAKAIIATPGASREFPHATEEIHSIINAVSRAYVKFNEGDEKA